MADPAALRGEREGRYILLHDPSDRTSFHHRHIPGTIAYYRDRFGFECLRTWRAPPVYAIVGRNRQAIHFRCAALATTRPNSMRTNCSTHTSMSKIQMRCMQVEVSRFRRTAGNNELKNEAVND